MAQRGLLGITLFSMFIIYCVFQICGVFMTMNTDETPIVVVSSEEVARPALDDGTSWEGAFGDSEVTEINKHMLPYPLAQAAKVEWQLTGGAPDPEALLFPNAEGAPVQWSMVNSQFVNGQ